MIHILYKIRASRIHGIGLFADQDIESGEKIYTPNPLLNVNPTKEQFTTLSPEEKKKLDIMDTSIKKRKNGTSHLTQ